MYEFWYKFFKTIFLLILALSSDFIVGFPGETKKDFKNTLRLVHEVKFAHAYSFKYSKRIGTKANRINCTLSEKEKNERLLELQNLLKNQISN